MRDFTQIDYLSSGNVRQRSAYKELKQLKIFENLSDYEPHLAGTIPIEIDIPGSDLDIICCCENHQKFSEKVIQFYKNQPDFSISTKILSAQTVTIAQFSSTNFPVEIYATHLPSAQQNAFKHMLIEYEILQKKGLVFRRKIIELKRLGVKTEPAFAQLLGLAGDPYKELLNWKK